MIIAFEGPDKTGKSTSVAEIAPQGVSRHSVTKDQYLFDKECSDTVAYDRIDWLTHQVYRLALPEYEWDDARIRTVFAMPDTHLVFKLHANNTAYQIWDELYEGADLARVNWCYSRTYRYLRDLNKALHYSLYASITLMYVEQPNESNATYRQWVDSIDSPFTVQAEPHNISNMELYTLLSSLSEGTSV